jgi:hypothetical protein
MEEKEQATKPKKKPKPKQQKQKKKQQKKNKQQKKKQQKKKSEAETKEPDSQPEDSFQAMFDAANSEAEHADGPPHHAQQQKQATTDLEFKDGQTIYVYDNSWNSEKKEYALLPSFTLSSPFSFFTFVTQPFN